MLRLVSALRRFPVDVRTALYLSTLAIPRGALTRAVAGAEGTPVIECDPSLRDPAFLADMMELLQELADKYFRWEVRGIERVPASGPALMVGNHNGGVVNTESYLTLLAVWNHFGPDRALCPLSHDLVFFDPVLAPIASRMGVLRAGHESAAKAFRQGHMTLVYPGSDLDAWRPFKDRGRIELGQRKGFLKLALREGVPIVPVVSAGTHEQMVVLARGDELARRSGIKRFLRAEAVPIVLSLPWGLTTGYLPYIPLPAQTTLQFGEPIRFEDVDPGQADDDKTLDRCYERVRSEMQALLDTVTEGRRWLLGQGKRRRS